MHVPDEFIHLVDRGSAGLDHHVRTFAEDLKLGVSDQYSDLDKLIPHRPCDARLRWPGAIGCAASRTPQCPAPAPVAQRIEQQPSNLSVVGSSPTGGAI